MLVGYTVSPYPRGIEVFSNYVKRTGKRKKQKGKRKFEISVIFSNSLEIREGKRTGPKIHGIA
jgi:hypothetical protein